MSIDVPAAIWLFDVVVTSSPTRRRTEPVAETRPLGTARRTFSTNRTEPSCSRSRLSSIVSCCVSVTPVRASLVTPSVGPKEPVSVMTVAVTAAIV